MHQFCHTRRPRGISRRRMLQIMAALGLTAGWRGLTPGYAASPAGRSDAAPASGEIIDLVIAKTRLAVAGRAVAVTTVNGSLPGPLLRLREGERARIRVTNQLDEDTSLHWHGVLVPPDMDGVPGLSFAGINPGATFTYEFPLRQSGTYWYHSHSGMQEPLGMYGPLIIEPAAAEPYHYDRDYVVLLSDWSFEDPRRILAKLKSDAGYYNFHKRTLADVVRDAARTDWGTALAEHLAWARMRMDPTDIADVTAATYTYLINGLAPADNWTALFKPGERVRLRLINGSAMSYFDVHIPGLQFTVVQADGQDVQPVKVEELRIAAAETYDVIVEPKEDIAYTLFAETMDRSGYARGTLAPRAGMSAALPARRTRSLRSMTDMGMAQHGGHVAAHETDPMDHDMSGMDMADMPGATPPAVSPAPPAAEPPPGSRLHEPGIGLGADGRRVLVYADLRSLAPGYDARPPGREIALHLTGNMERYMWSFDGKRYAEARAPIEFAHRERLRLTLINDTMMEHPIHLHGMWMELDNGAGAHKPRKHTVSVKPGERLSVDVTADVPGQWALHCHLFYHMAVGMFRVVSVAVPAEVRP